MGKGKRKASKRQEKEVSIICVRMCNRTPGNHPGRVDVCRRCKTTVWLSDSSLEAVKGKKHTLLCIECGRSEMKESAARGEEPPEHMPLTERQGHEILAALLRGAMHRQRN